MTPVAAPAVTSWLQLLGLIAVLVYMAYGQSVARQNATITQTKVEGVHGMLNSHLDEYKRTISDQSARDLEAHKLAFDASLSKIREENRATALLLQTQIDKRIADLEGTIASQKATIAGPTITQTPEQRLSEIRGEPK